MIINFDNMCEDAEEFPIILQDYQINILVSLVLNHINKQIKRYDAVLFKNAYIILHQYLNQKITRDNTESYLKKEFGNLDPLDELDAIFAFAKVTGEKETKSNFITDNEQNNIETMIIQNSSTNFLKLNELEKSKDDVPCLKGDGKPKRKQKAQWSHNEDRKLIYSILKFSEKNWEEIANFMGNNRTKAMCAQRWNRVLNPFISKCSWNAEEDDKLLKCVNNYGIRNWVKISSEIENRTDVQCRYRYQQLKKIEQYKEKTNKNSHSEIEGETNYYNYMQNQKQNEGTIDTMKKLTNNDSLHFLNEINNQLEKQPQIYLQAQTHTFVEQDHIFREIVKTNIDDEENLPNFVEITGQKKCTHDIKMMTNQEEEIPFFFFDEENNYDFFTDD